MTRLIEHLTFVTGGTWTTVRFPCHLNAAQVTDTARLLHHQHPAAAQITQGLHARFGATAMPYGPAEHLLLFDDPVITTTCPRPGQLVHHVRNGALEADVTAEPDRPLTRADRTFLNHLLAGIATVTGARTAVSFEMRAPRSSEAIDALHLNHTGTPTERLADLSPLVRRALTTRTVHPVTGRPLTSIITQAGVVMTGVPTRPRIHLMGVHPTAPTTDVPRARVLN